MNKGWKKVAWLCIFSTLLMGCYTSVIIDPRGEDKDEMDCGNVGYVITSDGTKYLFDDPPQVTEEAIIGEVDGKEVSIPLLTIVEANVTYFNAVGWTVLGASAAILCAAAYFAGSFTKIHGLN